MDKKHALLVPKLIDSKNFRFVSDMDIVVRKFTKEYIAGQNIKSRANIQFAAKKGLV